MHVRMQMRVHTYSSMQTMFPPAPQVRLLVNMRVRLCVVGSFILFLLVGC